VIIYWIYPKIVIRRHELKPLTVIDAPGLAEALHRLCRDVGLQHSPTFLIDIRNDADGGVAFGRLGRYYVRLNAGLLHKFSTDRPLFDAVVRHELAHLRNADVTITYLAVIGWWAFLVSALVVFAYDLIVWPADTLTMFVWRFALILLLVYWARNAILRVRELYADARAYQSDTASGALARVFERGDGEHNRLRGLFGFHPAALLRVAALENPESLFRISLLEAAAVGAAIGIALPMVAFNVGQILPVQLSLWASLLGLLIFVPFFVGGLGLGVWRETYASVTLGKRSSDAGRFGIVVGIGFLMGAQISPLPFMVSFEILPLSLGTRALTAGAMLLFLFLLFRWIAAGAKAWVGAVNSPLSLRCAYSGGLIIATILTAIGSYGLWLFGGTVMRLTEVAKVPVLGLITDPGFALVWSNKLN
jgi:Zn-dependent protease with chaperone function